MTHFKLLYRVGGGHVHVSVWGGKGPDLTHGRNGSLTFTLEEWEHFKLFLERGTEEISGVGTAFDIYDNTNAPRRPLDDVLDYPDEKILQRNNDGTPVVVSYDYDTEGLGGT